MSEKDYEEFLKRADKHFSDDRKRLVRIIQIQGLILVIAFVIMGIYGSYQLKQLKGQLTLASNSSQVMRTELDKWSSQLNSLALKPKDGRDGKSIKGDKGDKGDTVVGANGANGQNVTPEMVASATAAIIEADPERFRGPQGEAGESGSTLIAFVRQNPLTLLWECRYSNSLFWQPVAECGG